MVPSFYVGYLCASLVSQPYFSMHGVEWRTGREKIHLVTCARLSFRLLECWQSQSNVWTRHLRLGHTTWLQVTTVAIQQSDGSRLSSELHERLFERGNQDSYQRTGIYRVQTVPNDSSKALSRGKEHIRKAGSGLFADHWASPSRASKDQQESEYNEATMQNNTAQLWVVSIAVAWCVRTDVYIQTYTWYPQGRAKSKYLTEFHSGTVLAAISSLTMSP